MAGPNAEKAKLGPPPRWLKCPRHGKIIDNHFVPLKTPLCDLYDDQIREQWRFYVSMVFGVFKSPKIGLWIDLTNTDRFYRKEEVENQGAKYYKLNCRGHGECPGQEQTNLFIHICQVFLKENPGSLIAVHCTHGFNRTGFLIAAYLITEKDWSAEAAVSKFAEARPPGIYKEEYLRELFKRYDNEEDSPMAPALPDWCDEREPVLDDNEAESSGTNNISSSKAAPCVEGLPHVKLVKDSGKVQKLRSVCKKFCKWTRQDFPGSQPVSMDVQNLSLLERQVYHVTWKADGVRYLMLINGENEVYMFDRDFNAFFVPNLKFPHKKHERHIMATLLDGELIFDEDKDKKIPRYLIYDIIKYENEDVGWCDFGRRRDCIMVEIIRPRHVAIEKGSINKSAEPFSVRAKDFWDITQVENLLQNKFMSQVKHEIDGLIFQPHLDPYTPGRCQNVLKWKPHHLNSIDFKLKVVREHKEGMLPEFVGLLYVLNLNEPFDRMKVTKELMQYNNKIIECSYDSSGKWKFMRERRDKSFPNGYNTACGVMNSIKHPITKEFLVDFVKNKAMKPKGKGQKRPPTSVPNGMVADHDPKRPRNGISDGGGQISNGSSTTMPPPPVPPKKI